jgi:hypothetical protein
MTRSICGARADAVVATGKGGMRRLSGAGGGSTKHIWLLDVFASRIVSHFASVAARRRCFDAEAKDILGVSNGIRWSLGQ